MSISTHTFKKVSTFLIAASVTLPISIGVSQAAEKNGISYKTEAGLGYDDNVFRAPLDGSYFDYPNNTRTLVTSKIQDGFYIPFTQDIKYINRKSKSGLVSGKFKLDGDYYIDSDLSNANHYKYKLNVGYSWIFGEKKSKSNSFYAGIIYGHKENLYLDRDTGDEQVFQQQDISERYIHDFTGVEAKLENELSKIQYAVKVKQETRDYKDVPNATESQYDHDYFYFSGQLAYKPTKHGKIKGKYAHYTYEYDERNARDSEGTLSKLNPTREYIYDVYSLTWRQRLSNPLVVYLDYEFKTREDKYVGYDNYDKNKYKVRVNYVINPKMKAKFSYWIWDRAYENAFAFDDPSQVKKDYDGFGFSVKLAQQLKQDRAIEYAIRYTDDNSTDTRYDYERMRASVKYVMEY